MRTQLILNALRIVFLLASVAAVATALGWDRIKVHVDPYDEALIERHLRGPTEALAAARASLEAGETERGLGQLAALAEELRGVRLGTRLEPVRTATLDLLSDRHLVAGHDEEAMAWTEELLQYNPRDFPALLRRAELHRRAGRDALELADVEAAYRVGAASGAAIAPYVSAMARRGRSEEVAEALLALGSQGPLVIPTRDWEFRWAPGGDFAFEPGTGLRVSAMDDTGGYTGIPALPAGSIRARSVRVDLPPGCHMALRALDVALEAGGGEVTHLTLQDLAVANHLTAQPDGTFVADGQLDPYVILQRDGAAAVEGIEGITVGLALAPALPAAVGTLFPEGLSDEQRSRWTARHGAELVNALEVGLGR
ncbi:hypothetical protein Poly30_06310 [Planctomycetes bacterium Poly30]|uniref:Tetratricopeptide repeat protein n=1 Tax=Saltatorellus ferox TaxID=2528018 RepID=A0A518EM20_9BACT|nr:hypothetical protein Poly30_06310 [Planctomycetes bacterium Poly30]